jgi:hypothetical protein
MKLTYGDIGRSYSSVLAPFSSRQQCDYVIAIVLIIFQLLARLHYVRSEFLYIV